jgi:transcriptional regulator with XRE-family HTH domain
VNEGLIARARALTGLSQDELARRSGTSRPTLSAYERGRKSPSLSTAARILRVAGFRLGLEPEVRFREVTLARGRVVTVPDGLWRLPVPSAVASVTLPRHLDWSGPPRSHDLGERAQRARVYEVVLREGGADDLLAYVDGVLLLDLWPELVLPREIRRAWQPVIDAARNAGSRPAAAS